MFGDFTKMELGMALSVLGLKNRREEGFGGTLYTRTAGAAKLHGGLLKRWSRHGAHANKKSFNERW